MGKAGKSPSWSIPEYQDPTYKTFANNGGSTSYADNKFSYTPNAANQDFQTQLDATRAAILKHMGGTDQAANDSLNNWQKTYFDEANRLTQPQLENSLFDRGLGGSNFYAGSLNDLLTKNSNQAILNKYQLQNQDFNQNQTAFTNVNNAEQGLTTDANNLLTMSANYANNQDARNMDLYKTTLPYKATFTQGQQGQGFGGLIGAGVGAIGGAFVGNPIMGAQLGSQIGGGIDASQGNGSYGSQVYQPTLQALSFANLPGSAGVTPGQVSSFGGGTAPTNFNPATRANTPNLNFSYLR